MVDIKAFLTAVGRLAWRWGAHEKVRHVVDADGNHTITIVVPKTVAKWEPPKELLAPWRGPTASNWDALVPPKGSKK